MSQKKTQKGRKSHQRSQRSRKAKSRAKGNGEYNAAWERGKVVPDMSEKIKWSQRGISFFGFFSVVFFILARGTYLGYYIATCVFSVLTIGCFVAFYYRNISWAILKLTLKQGNVRVVLISAAMIFVIDILVHESHEVVLSAIFGFVYMAAVLGTVFLDAIKEKSRGFVLTYGLFFTALNLYNIYRRTFDNSELGLVLLKYNINGNEYTFMVRSTKRAIFAQIMFFCLRGIYTMIRDKEMKLLMFVTAKIYRKTEFDGGGKEKGRVRGSRRISVEVLGEQETVTIDERFEERIKFAEIGIGVCAFAAVVSFTISI